MGISFNIEGIPALKSKLDALVSGERMHAALENAGEKVRSAAAANCPVQTGRLRDSITSQVDGNSVSIGSDVEYAAKVEYGGEGRGPKPFLVPALLENEGAIVDAFREVYTP